MLEKLLLPPAVLFHSLLVQMNVRFANTGAQCGTFPDAISEMIQLKLSQGKAETTAVSEDPGREPSNASEASPLV